MDLSCRYKRAGAGQITANYQTNAKAKVVIEKMKEDKQWEWIQKMNVIYRRVLQEIVGTYILF